MSPQEVVCSLKRWCVPSIVICNFEKESILPDFFEQFEFSCRIFARFGIYRKNDKFALYYLLSACNLIVLSEQLSAVCERLEIDCFDNCVLA